MLLILCHLWLLGVLLNYKVTAEVCKSCMDVVSSFKKGMERTARYNFGGGDADWEEKKLGSYGNSETRFVEIMEDICKSDVDNKDECHSLAEANEEKLEDWWFHKQKAFPDLYYWLCINYLKVCCPANTYGKDCQPCPGGVKRPCFNNGDCDGEGTRKGSGKCNCHSSFKGDLCDSCSLGYREEFRNKSHVSCLDIDECDEKSASCEENQYCENIPGSYKCHDCDASCIGCTGTGPSNCVECKEGFSLHDRECKEGDKLWQGPEMPWAVKIIVTYTGLMFSLIFLIMGYNHLAGLVILAISLLVICWNIQGYLL